MSRERDEFDTAGPSVPLKDLLGELCLFYPTEHVEEVQTSFGTKDAVLTDVVVLSQKDQPEYQGVMVLQGKMIGLLKRKIGTGRPTLGVVAKGEAKKGQNQPYILDAPNDLQKQVARDFLAGRTVDAAAVAATSGEPKDPFAA